MVQDYMKRRPAETCRDALVLLQGRWGDFDLAWLLLLVIFFFHLISFPPNFSRDGVASLVAAY